MEDLTISQSVPLPETSFSVAWQMIEKSWQEVDQQVGSELDRTQRRRLLSDLRKLVLPTSRRGRKPEPIITAAVRDFQAGLTWESLYEKYIPGWAGMSRARRHYEAQALESNIRTRLRRDKELPQKGAGEPDIVLEGNTNSHAGKRGGRKPSDLPKLELLDDSEIEFVEA